MNDCEKYKNLIEKYFDGIVTDSELTELRTHTKTCQHCREEFERCAVLQDAIRQAFLPQTAAEQAKASILTRLSAEPNRRPVFATFSAAWFAGRRAAIAAGIVLVVGLLLGFALGRASTVEPSGVPLATEVPIRVGQIEGTVLVRHKSSDVWQVLETGTNIYLGDTFHSAAKSTCVLKLDDKSTLELNQNSMLVLKLHNGETQFFLENGECTASLESPHGPFFINTPSGRLEAVGTEFTVKVTDE